MSLLSARKIIANRANAQRSTGPKTPEGKAASSQNAYKYGIRLCELYCDEDAEEYQDLASGLFEQYAPQTPVESLALESLVSYAWRLRRIRRIESARYEENLHRVEDLGFQSEHHRESRAFFWNGGKDMTVLYRYEASMQRGLKNAIAQLESLQRNRAEYEESANEEPAVAPPAFKEAAFEFPAPPQEVVPTAAVEYHQQKPVQQIEHQIEEPTAHAAPISPQEAPPVSEKVAQTPDVNPFPPLPQRRQHPNEWFETNPWGTYSANLLPMCYLREQEQDV